MLPLDGLVLGTCRAARMLTRLGGKTRKASKPSAMTEVEIWNLHTADTKELAP
jgi:hypothetical protein